MIDTTHLTTTSFVEEIISAPAKPCDAMPLKARGTFKLSNTDTVIKQYDIQVDRFGYGYHIKLNGKPCFLSSLDRLYIEACRALKVADSQFITLVLRVQISDPSSQSDSTKYLMRHPINGNTLVFQNAAARNDGITDTFTKPYASVLGSPTWLLFDHSTGTTQLNYIDPSSGALITFQDEVAFERYLKSVGRSDDDLGDEPIIADSDDAATVLIWQDAKRHTKWWTTFPATANQKCGMKYEFTGEKDLLAYLTNQRSESFFDIADHTQNPPSTLSLERHQDNQLMPSATKPDQSSRFFALFALWAVVQQMGVPLINCAAELFSTAISDESMELPKDQGMPILPEAEMPTSIAQDVIHVARHVWQPIQWVGDQVCAPFLLPGVTAKVVNPVLNYWEGLPENDTPFTLSEEPTWQELLRAFKQYTSVADHPNLRKLLIQHGDQLMLTLILKSAHMPYQDSRVYSDLKIIFSDDVNNDSMVSHKIAQQFLRCLEQVQLPKLQISFNEYNFNQVIGVIPYKSRMHKTLMIDLGPELLKTGLKRYCFSVEHLISQIQSAYGLFSSEEKFNQFLQNHLEPLIEFALQQSVLKVEVLLNSVIRKANNTYLMPKGKDVLQGILQKMYHGLLSSLLSTFNAEDANQVFKIIEGLLQVEVLKTRSLEPYFLQILNKVMHNNEAFSYALNQVKILLSRYDKRDDAFHEFLIRNAESLMLKAAANRYASQALQDIKLEYESIVLDDLEFTQFLHTKGPKIIQTAMSHYNDKTKPFFRSFLSSFKLDSQEFQSYVTQHKIGVIQSILFFYQPDMLPELKSAIALHSPSAYAGLWHRHGRRILAAVSDFPQARHIVLQEMQQTLPQKSLAKILEPSDEKESESTVQIQEKKSAQGQPKPAKPAVAPKPAQQPAFETQHKSHHKKVKEIPTQPKISTYNEFDLIEFFNSVNPERIPRKIGHGVHSAKILDTNLDGKPIQLVVKRASNKGRQVTFLHAALAKFFGVHVPDVKACTFQDGSQPYTCTVFEPRFKTVVDLDSGFQHRFAVSPTHDESTHFKLSRQEQVMYALAYFFMGIGDLHNSNLGRVVETGEPGPGKLMFIDIDHQNKDARTKDYIVTRFTKEKKYQRHNGVHGAQSYYHDQITVGAILDMISTLETLFSDTKRKAQFCNIIDRYCPSELNPAEFKQNRIELADWLIAAKKDYLQHTTSDSADTLFYKSDLYENVS